MANFTWTDARNFCSDWHSGGGSAFYQLSSTGGLPDALDMSIEVKELQIIFADSDYVDNEYVNMDEEEKKFAKFVAFLEEEYGHSHENLFGAL